MTQLHKPAQAFIRTPDHPVLPLFVNRWSPRSFKPDPVSREVLDSMVEAARWAPSSINLQPWKFFIANGPSETRDSWNTAIGGGNRPWSNVAPVLVWVVARKTMGPNPYAAPEAPNRFADFDAGAATIQFVLEGERHGIKSHYMGGIDAALAHNLLGLDAEHEVICAIAIGHPGLADVLAEPYRSREKPSSRKAASEIATFVEN